MDNWKRKIDYKKYDSTVLPTLPKSTAIKTKWNILNESIAESGTFEISYFQLLISTAKSILTRSDVYSAETAAFARSYMQTLPFLLNDKDGYLTMNHENINILRDFSKSSRNGEIAQGINYYFSKKYLGAYAIYDFKYYADVRRKIRPKCKGKTPDYVLCYSDNTIGFIESKGTLIKNPSKYMESGNEQCSEGKNHLPGVANTYVSAVSFATSSPHMTRKTCLYIADPENNEKYLDNNIEYNNNYEYSKLFYFVGNKNATLKLMNGQQLEKDDFDYTKKQDGEIIIATVDNDKLISSHAKKIEIGIKEPVLEYLIDKKKFEKFENIYSESYELFNDGIFVRVK